MVTEVPPLHHPKDDFSSSLLVDRYLTFFPLRHVGKFSTTTGRHPLSLLSSPLLPTPLYPVPSPQNPTPLELGPCLVPLPPSPLFTLFSGLSPPISSVTSYTSVPVPPPPYYVALPASFPPFHLLLPPVQLLVSSRVSRVVSSDTSRRRGSLRLQPRILSLLSDPCRSSLFLIPLLLLIYSSFDMGPFPSPPVVGPGSIHLFIFGCK